MSATFVHADDWTFFRGPTFDGNSRELAWKESMGDISERIVWSKEVGIGAASFVVKGNQVVTTGNESDQDIIWCFDLSSGKKLWDYRYPCKFEKRMFEGGTSGTPTIDGEHVYNLSYDGQLHCVRLASGEKVWSRHLVDEFGGKLSRWKYATSPLVVGDLLITDCGGSKNSTLALNKLTGEKVWGQGEEKAGYSTPIPMKQGEETIVVMFKGKSLVARSAKTGKRLWNVPWETSYDVNASSPVPLANNQLLTTSGYGGGRAVLFQLGKGKPEQLWRNDDIKTKMSSAVVHNGYVFAVCGDNSGRLVCVKLSDGSTAWTQKGFGFGTLALANGQLVILSESGTLVFAQASGAGYKELSRAQILGKRCWVNPVIANGFLLAKNNKGKTVCLRLK